MVTIMAIVADRDGLSLEGLVFRGEKLMTSNPRRIEEVNLVIDMPSGLTSSQRGKLERAALTCPVKNTLSSEVATPVEFRYPD